MTAEQRFDHDLPELLTDLLDGPAPDYRDHIVHATAGIRQRPRWTFPERWLPMQAQGLIRSDAPPLPWRALVVMTLLVIAIVGALLLAGGPEVRLPPPFGVAGNGLIAFTAGEERSILLIDPTTGERRQIGNGSSPQFSPDGTKLAFIDGNGIDPAHLVVAASDGRSQIVLEPAIPDGPLGAFAWSADGGTLVYSHKASGALFLYDATGEKPVQQVATGDYITPGSFRPPDGRQLLVARTTGEGYSLLLVSKSGVGGGSPILDVPSSSAVFVSSDGRGPWSWSPDGSRLAVSVARDPASSERRIVVVNADGSGIDELTTVDVPVLEAQPQWSPDGSRILYRRSDPIEIGGSIVNAWVIWPLGGGEPLEIRPLGGAASWSPDGRLLLLQAYEDVWRIVDLDRGARTVREFAGRGIPSWQRLALP